ncbi:CocE/NonD family hydrolase [Mycolicibacterium diernhoferi]|uniref:Hydrolase n=2 Tax=Mycolicibacterium diernhoferi TaxID=1801 RepID=A0A1Q4HAK6_9MYCO|nr:CocE/NonD family hydrolase [Mycolicibacterium diernhoferi]OJZ64563.1 hydrolase [Mycolicibacterium diernhoferi]OPE47344.1 hydrolase [Mycolicibacterium diernhoferi]
MSPRPSYLGRHALSRALQLPTPTNDYVVHRRVRIPMRDGVELLADHYEPRTAHPAGTILVRAPYGRRFPFTVLFGSIYATRGYHVVFQSVRGTFGSGGEFTPMVNEVDDGADTVVWLREQPWFTGTFATIGLSYLGFTQWALLTDPPPELAAAVITVGPHDFAQSSWGTGAFSLNDFLGWSDMVSHQEDPGLAQAVMRQALAGRRVQTAALDLPLAEGGRALLGDGAQWYESWLRPPQDDPEHWRRLGAVEALDRVEVPVLLLSGWQDLFLDQTLTQYRHLRARGVPTALTVGSWTHTQMMTKGGPTVVRETLDWLGTHLSGRPDTRRNPVRLHIHNDGWVELPDLPTGGAHRDLYLLPGGRLGETAGDATASSFTYDPAHPTPTIGGRLLSSKGGYREDSALARRADVLAFTGEPLAADVYTVGTPVLELTHRADNPHHDVFVRISEVDAQGRSHNVTDGYRRYPDGSGPVRVELDAVAHRFAAGSRIRVLVAGGSHPRYARNLGTGEPALSGQTLRSATHTVTHDEGSRLILPAADGPPSAH